MAAPTPAPPVTIRPLRRSDGAGFSEVVVGSYGPFERMLGLDAMGEEAWRGLFRPGLWFLFRLLRGLRVVAQYFFVAVEGGRVVGTTGLSRWATAGYVFAVGVRPSHQRRGIASRLLDRAEAETARRRLAWAVLDVEEENAPAVRLYRARGYDVVGTVHWHRRDPAGARDGAPDPDAPVRPLAKHERRAAAAWCASRLPAAWAAVLPPTERRLSHLETLGLFPGAILQVWALGPPQAPQAVLTGVRRAAGQPGLLVLVAVGADVPAASVGRLIEAGAAWLGQQGASASLLAVPDYVAGVAPTLAAQGFVAELATLTMARRLGTPGGASGGPKGP